MNLQLNYWTQTYTFRRFLFVTTLVRRIDSLESCLALAIFRVQATEQTFQDTFQTSFRFYGQFT